MSNANQILLVKLISQRFKDLLDVEVLTSLDIHKSIYLAQKYGVDIGYRFEWTNVGVLSPGLADDLIELLRAEGGAQQLQEGFSDDIEAIADDILEMAEGEDTLQALGAAADSTFLHSIGGSDDIGSWLFQSYPKMSNAVDRFASWSGPFTDESTY